MTDDDYMRLADDGCPNCREHAPELPGEPLRGTAGYVRIGGTVVRISGWEILPGPSYFSSQRPLGAHGCCSSTSSTGS